MKTKTYNRSVSSSPTNYIYLWLLLFVFATSIPINAQIGINTTTPNASAILDIEASDKGILIPRISLTNVNVTMLDGTNTAATGLLIYNTNVAVVGGNGVGYYFFNGTIWEQITTTTNSNDDGDWYKEGTATSPNNINDDIFTQGNVAIGKTMADYALDIDEPIDNRGINLVVSGTDNNTKSGQYIEVSNTGTGSHFGLKNVLSGGGTGQQTGSFQYITNTGDADHVGTYNYLIGSGDGKQYGSHNVIGNVGSGVHYGSYNDLATTVWTIGEKYGSYQKLNSFGSGANYGSYNTIIGSGSGTHYGTYNLINSTGSGDKYGIFNSIGSGLAGTHYGLYSEVLKTGSYAGYFLGKVAIGTTTANNYLLPSSRGTANQVMQTDGNGNVIWIDNTTVGSTNTLDQAYDEGGAGAGRTITATDGAVTIAGEDGLLVSGTLSSGDLAPSGAGTKMFFNPRKAAFRAGNIDGTGTQWDDANIGNYSVAMGASVKASGIASIALGGGAIASGNFSFAEGWLPRATAQAAVALGFATKAFAPSSIALGNETTASGNSSTAMGANTTASGHSSTAMGTSTLASGTTSTALGTDTTASGESSLATGYSTIASGLSSSSMGFSTAARSFAETSIGLYLVDYTPNNITGWDATDRLFVIGNGVDGGNRSNALTIYKNGLMNINDAYNMPLTDGTASQIMQTDGSGNVSWATPTGDISGVTAGDGLTGGGTTGAITVDVVANNGLTANANDIRLGGTLIQTTTITQGSYDMIFNLNNFGDFKIQDNGVDHFEVNSAGNSNFGGDTYWKDINTTGTNLASVTDNGDDGRFQIYENGSTSVDLNANTGFVFNEQGLNRDFRIEGDTETNLFRVDAGNDRIGIMEATPNTDIHLKQSTTTLAGSGGMSFEDSGDSDIWKIYHSGTHFSFAENGIRRVYIQAGTGNYIQPSDVRLKRDFILQKNYLAKVNDINIYSYFYKNQTNNKRNLGIKAQEILQIFPELISEGEDGYLGMNYGGLSVVAIQAIKEQQEVIETLKSENIQLKKYLLRLEERLIKLETQQKN